MSFGFAAPELIDPNEVSFDYTQFTQVICDFLNKKRNIHTHPVPYTAVQIENYYSLFFKNNLPFDRLRYFMWHQVNLMTEGFEIIRASVVVKNIIIEIESFNKKIYDDYVNSDTIHDMSNNGFF
jgi:hypothetical protein